MFTKDYASSKRTTKNVTVFAVFAALAIVLQVIASTVFPVIHFNFTLALIPIIMCSILLGPGYGALNGIVFSLVVIVFCLTGTDIGGNILISQRPILTTIIVLAKGALAGFLPGVVYKPFKNKKIATFIAAMSSPIGNTGLFAICLPVFYSSTLKEWANGSSALVYLFTQIVGINFIIEFTLSIILAPVFITVMKAFETRSVRN